MTHFAGDHGKVADHPVVHVPPEPQGATATYRTPPVSEQGGPARGSHGKQDGGTQPQQQEHYGKETKGSGVPKPSAESG